MRFLFALAFSWSLSTWASPSYFCATYEDCRAQFRQEAHLARAEMGKLPIPSTVDPNLTVDYAYFRPLETPKDLLILSSGVHGVEGYAGSAIQRQFIRDTLAKLDRKNLGVLVLHLVNPFGTKYRRRVSENNVDLNRNFERDGKLFTVTNKAYGEIDGMLNPAKPASDVWWSVATFYARTVKQLTHTSVRSLRQAILGGQYEFPKGVFYGGKSFEPQVRLIEQLVKKYSGPYKRALILDLHTGYGKEKTLHLIPNSPHPADVQAGIDAVFSGYPLEDPEGEEFYRNYGNFSTFLSTILEEDKKLGIPMVLEFGTYDNTGIIGGMEALRRMVNENQAYHFGAVSDQAKENICAEFLEWFFPASDEWRNSLLSVSSRWLPHFIANFQKY
jgi:hypothetical protein